MKPWSQSLARWLDVCLETTCPLCQRSSPNLLCPSCHRQVLSCQSSHPDQHWRGDLPVFTWGIYGGALKRAIALMKYDQKPQLAELLGHALADAWLMSPRAKERSLVVVPIPMHAEKQRQRGYNQAALLARAFCRVTRLPVQEQGLVRCRETQAQHGLSADAREQNLADAFQLGSGLRQRASQKSVLLLDDIYTTGATGRAAATVLRHHQIPLCGLITIAHPLTAK